MKHNNLTAALRAALGTEQARRAVDDWADRRPVAEDGSPLAPEIRDGRLRLHLHCPIGPFYGCADGSDFAAAWRDRHDMPTDIFVDSPAAMC